MKKALSILCIYMPFIVHSQFIIRSVTPENLPNLTPGYSQVSSINQQSLSFTYTLQPDPPQPIDGDTTTEDNGPLKYGEVIPVNYSLVNGNYTQTSEGKVWTLSIKVLGGCKNIGLTFEYVNLSSNAELYIYNESRTVLRGPVKAENFRQPGLLTTGASKDSIIYIYLIERNNFSSFQSSLIITKLIAGFLDISDLTDTRIASMMGTQCMLHVQCFPDKMLYAHAVARIETGGWLGTGTLINNEGNNARPFFLTAFHVVDLNNDNQITANEIEALRTANFVFQFWRNACNSNDINVGIEFAGATLRATRPTHGGSDMALVELNDRRALV
jgi:hypothetical protein